MDPLETTTSITTVLQLSSKVAQYINGATGASKQRKRLREEIRACEQILQLLKDESDDSDEGKGWLQTIQALEAPGAPLGQLWVALNVVGNKLQPKSRLKETHAVLKWPFEEKELQRIIDTIEHEKSLLQLALTNECRKLIQSIQRCSRESKEKLADLLEAARVSSDGLQSSLKEVHEALVIVQQAQTSLGNGINQLEKYQGPQETEKERSNILNWLTSIDYTAQQNDFLNRRQSGTGQWLSDSVEFRNWLQVKNQTLFCPGIPGAGKTILVSIAVDSITSQFRGNPEVGVAFLYNNFRLQDQQKAEDLLSSLLKQLCQGRSTLPACLKELYSYHSDKRSRPSMDEIMKALETVAAMYSRVFLIIDALDECQASSRLKFLPEIFRLQQKLGINVMATSRFVPEIMDKFTESVSLEIRATKEDVQRYLEGHMDELPSCVQGKPELQNEISNTISEATDGMFLLAQIYFGSLDDKLTIKAVKNALCNFQKQGKSLGKGEKAEMLANAYGKAMEKINGQKAGLKSLALQVLSWITCTKTPLNTSELQHALATEAGMSTLDQDNLPQVDDMVNVCAGLVTVDRESNVIRLVHYTTQIYFEQTRHKWFPGAETEITSVCTTYLSFQDFSVGYCQSDDEFHARLRDYPLYEYAAHQWGNHARSVSSDDSILVFLQARTNVQASTQSLMANTTYKWRNYSQHVPRNMTELHLAAYFGLDKVMAAVGDDYLETLDTYGRTPLWYAAESGHEAAVRLLLAKSAKVEIYDKKYGQNPLILSVRKGHEAVVRLLLENGADIEAYDEEYGQTPLLCAAREGHDAIARILLENGAEIEAKDKEYGQTPLICAARNGHEGTVRMLLEKGADTAAFDKDFLQTPLIWANEEGHESIAELLLDKTILNRDGKARHKLLIDAAKKGQDILVRLLLENGVEIEPDGSFDQSPLSAAAKGGHATIVQQLLDKGANVEAKGSSSLNPLLWAASKGHEIVVQQLLSHGANIEARGSAEYTALLIAASEGHDGVVQKLLDNGADVKASNPSGKSALFFAIKKGHKSIVQQLLDKGADVEARGSSRWTPLMWAAYKGHIGIVQLLLKKGAGIEEKGSSSRNALFCAVQGGHEDIVRLLLWKDAKIDVVDSKKWTPLWLAVSQENVAIVRLLLENGAQADGVQDSNYTPLVLATAAENDTIIQLLRDGGASVEKVLHFIEDFKAHADAIGDADASGDEQV